MILFFSVVNYRTFTGACSFVISYQIYVHIASSCIYIYSLDIKIQMVGSGGDDPISGETFAPVSCGEVPQTPIVTSSSEPVG
jgi:hypothetical protein